MMTIFRLCKDLTDATSHNCLRKICTHTLTHIHALELSITAPSELGTRKFIYNSKYRLFI